PDLSSDLGDRASGVDDQTRGLLPVLRGVTLPLCTHEGILPCQGRTWRSGCPPNGVNLRHRLSGLCGHGCEPVLEGYRADLTERGVASAAVVDVLDPGADRLDGLGSRGEGVPVVELG